VNACDACAEMVKYIADAEFRYLAVPIKDDSMTAYDGTMAG